MPNLSAWLCIVWGGFCANPVSDLFAKNPHLFAPMRGLYDSEIFWGVLFLAFGAIGLICSILGRRRFSASLMFVVYMLFAGLYFLGDYSQPGFVFFGSIGIANLLIGGADILWNRNR